MEMVMVVPTVMEENESGPDFAMDLLWRSGALPDAEAEILRLQLWTLGMLHWDMRTCVERLQSHRGSKLQDLTWTEAFEAFFEFLCAELRLARKLLHQSEGKDRQLQRAVEGIKKLLRRAYKAHQAWLEETTNGPCGDLLKAYRRQVVGYWRDQASMRRYTTERRRQEAKRLRSRLDRDPHVIELRRRLRVPHGGFQDVDQAAYWLYERRPHHELITPPCEPPYALIAHGPRTLLASDVNQISALVEAARRLCERYELDPQWDFSLHFYLLWGRVEPPPRRRKPRKRPMAQRDEYLLDLMKRHNYRHTQIIYNSGLSEEEFQRIVEAHPGASNGKLEWLCYDIGADKGCLREDEIQYDNLRKIKSRWGWSDTAS